MEKDGMLAGRPPYGSLLKAAILLGLVVIAAFIIVAMITSEKNLLDPQAGGVFWFRVVVMVLFGIFGLWMLVLFIRQLSRWALTGAGVYVSEAGFRFAIPHERGWWYPVLKIEEKDVPIVGLRDSHFDTSDKSTLTVKTDEDEIEIQSGTFHVGGYTLDSRLRQSTSDTLKPIEPEKVWSASLGVRMVMIVIGLILFLGPGILIGIFGLAGSPGAIESASKASAPLFIAGIALLALSVLHRGQVVVDGRGVFFERGGKVSFISWEALAGGGVKYRREMLTFGLWSNLSIETHSTFKRKADCRIRLTRIAGLGFPLRKIEKFLTSRLQELTNRGTIDE